ncbi:MAG: acyl-CoA reductase [Myxococcales bacterium]|nr:proline dehydrogenase [Polyangiaceae bacterium]MDW8251018.1 acyl-CoA reductase [Myxococcales bacterium]
MGARERVLRVLAGAARLTDRSDPLHREAIARLPTETGLPAPSVLAALDACLERSATHQELTSLLASVPLEQRVHVVLAGNVFVAPVRALALAWASAPEVLVKPSHRGRVVPELLLRALQEDGGRDGSIALTESLSAKPGESVHAYGSDATLEAIQGTLPPGTRFWGHGHGFGITVLDTSSSEIVRGLARDVAYFDQRGCLSPRLVLWIGSEEGGVALARKLHGELEVLARELPPGREAPEETAARHQYLAAMEAVGDIFSGATAVVGFQSGPEGLIVPSFPRGVHTVQISSPKRARELLAPWAQWITCLGGNGAAAEQVAQGIPWARRAAPGHMQRPPLDGPVDRRHPAPSPGR